MAVFRIDLLVEDPNPVFDWLDENVVPGNLFRKMAYQTVKGWYMKVVFKRREDAESFNSHWHFVSRTKEVAPFGWIRPV
jgi:hypothetical protein